MTNEQFAKAQDIKAEIDLCRLMLIGLEDRDYVGEWRLYYGAVDQSHPTPSVMVPEHIVDHIRLYWQRRLDLATEKFERL